MRGIGARRTTLLLMVAFFLLIGRRPETRFGLERARAADPVANDDTYDAVVGVILDIPAPGILANDTDADNDALSVDVITMIELPPPLSTMFPNPNGSFTYLASSSGTDTYQYRVSDGTNFSPYATITFHVDTRPVAQDDHYTTTINTPISINTASGVLSNDSDAENDPITAAVVDAAAHGVLTFSNDGSFGYTPNTDFAGTDTFTYKANDGKANSGGATVTIVVNGPPVAVDDSYFIGVNGVLNLAAPGLLANDTDPNNDPLSVDFQVVLFQSPPQHGSLNINADGSLTYRPVQGFEGTDSFQYQSFDGVFLSNIATVPIHVENVSPPLAAPDRNYFTSLPIALTWSEVTGAVGYQVQVSTSSTFMGSPVLDVNQPVYPLYLSIAAPFADQHYYWRVRAILIPNTKWGAWVADSFTLAAGG